MHVVGGVGRQPGLRHRPRPAVPARRHRADRRAACWSAPTSPRPCRRPRGTSTGCASAAVTSSSSTRGVRRPPTRADLHPPAGARHRPRPRARAAAPAASPPARSTRTTSPRAPTGFDDVRRAVAAWWPERVERVTRRRRRASCARWPTLLAGGRPRHGADRARRRAARQGTDTVLAWINVALALGMPGRRARRLRLPHRPGQRAGRPRARPEGRPAARLPDDRRPRRPRRTSPGCGASTPTTLPGKGRSAYELLDALGTDGGPKALLVFGSNIVVSAPNATHVADAARRPRPARRRRPRDVARPPRSPTWCCRSRSGPRRPAP